MKQFMLAAVLVVSCLGLAFAEEIKPIDLNNPFQDARAGYAWGAEGNRVWTIHVPLIYKVGPVSGREYATFNLGIGNKVNSNRIGYSVSIGLRLDTFFAKASETNFAKKQLRFAILPPFQITPCFITTDFKKFVPMIAAVTKFGGK